MRGQPSKGKQNDEHPPPPPPPLPTRPTLPTLVLTFALRLSVGEDIAVVRHRVSRQGRGASGLLEGAPHHRGGLASVLQ